MNVLVAFVSFVLGASLMYGYYARVRAELAETKKILGDVGAQVERIESWLKSKL